MPGAMESLVSAVRTQLGIDRVGGTGMARSSVFKAASGSENGSLSRGVGAGIFQLQGRFDMEMLYPKECRPW